ncbi:MAG: hypothetical protein RL681_268 [Candidatus Parcubacteria bacterium]
MYRGVGSFIGNHKLVSLVVVLIVGGGAYWWFTNANQTGTQAQYVTAPVTRGTLAVTVSGSGQVSSANQLDVKAKASGDVLTVFARSGQSIAAGAPLVSLDASDAQKTIRDAEASLASAQLSLEKLKQSSADVNQLLEDSFADVSSAFLDLPDIVATAEETLLGKTINAKEQDNKGYYQDFVRSDDAVNYQKNIAFISIAESDYRAARKAYDTALLTYKDIKLGADTETLRSILNETLDTVKLVGQSLKSEQNLLDFLSDYATTYSKNLPATVTAYKTKIRTNIGTINSHLSALASSQSAVDNAPLDIASQELAVQQRENALADAREKLADYTVRAPFAGIIAVMDIERGNSVSSGGTIATLIAHQRIAEISLNEVDAANIAVGQTATLTFDALPGLKAEGAVSAIDTLGTVSQGVVNYVVKITFDTPDERVKPGMSVSASITTATKENVLLVPNAAVKTEGELTYVEVLDTFGSATSTRSFPRQFTSSSTRSSSTRSFASSTPSSGYTFGGGRRRSSSTTASSGTAQASPLRRIPITIGLANDTMTEVISGLTEGQQVVTRTIAAGTATTATQSTPSTVRLPGIGGGGFRPRD